eukprot:358995_1
MSRHGFLLLLLVVLYSLFDGYEAYSTLNTSDSTFILHQILSYVSKDNLNDLNNNANICSIATDNMYNLSEWNNTNVTDILYSKKALVAEECSLLNLTDPLCEEDCVYYSDPTLWILLIIENTNTSIILLNRIINFYAMGAMTHEYALEWFNIGNPSMCLLRNGTYCYTPAMTPNGRNTINAHGCCVPGSCTHDDAIKVLHNNDVCWGQFKSWYGNRVRDICEPMARELDQTGPMIVILIFIIFFLIVIITSIIKQCQIEFNYGMGMLTNNFVVNSFNIQQSWNNFVSRRPVQQSQFNFLDGIRVLSMTWVIYGHSYLFWRQTRASNLQTFIPPNNYNADVIGGNPKPPQGFTYLINQFYMIFAQYGFYSVDSFFWLSGFLGAFSIHRKCMKYGNNVFKRSYIWIPLSFVGRYLRIAPIMMYLTAIEWQICDQLSYGYHVTSRDLFRERCDEGYEYLFLFYNNLQDQVDYNQCMGELWYIQCDMQMFILLPFIILLFQYKKLYGII